MATDTLIIGDMLCVRSATADLDASILEAIHDFRVAEYGKVLPDANFADVERYVEDGMQTWVDANEGVKAGTLNPNQLFGRTAVWLAYDKSSNLVGEVLSADNVSGGDGSIVGQASRQTQMHAPVWVSHRSPFVRRSPYRAVREVLGTREAVAPLLFKTAIAAGSRPMTAYEWKEEELLPFLREAGFAVMSSKITDPLGTGQLVTEQSLRASSGNNVAKTMLGQTPGLATALAKAVSMNG